MHSDIDYFILYNVEQTQETASNKIISKPKEIAVTVQNEIVQTRELSDKKDNQDTLIKEDFLPPQIVRIMNMKYYGILNLMD